MEELSFVEGYGPYHTNRAQRRAHLHARPEGWGARFTRRTHAAAVRAASMSSRVRRNARPGAAAREAGQARAAAFLRACNEGRANEGMRPATTEESA